MNRSSSLRTLLVGLVLVGATAALWWVLRSQEGGSADTSGEAGGDERATAEGAEVPMLAGREEGKPAEEAAARPRVAGASLPMPEGPSVHLVGRVLASGRRPAAGAEVIAHAETWDAAPVRTGPDGRFRLATALPPPGEYGRVRVVAADGAGRVAARTTYLGPTTPEEHDVGTLVFGEGHPVAVRVRGACAGTSQATVWAVEHSVSGGAVHARALADGEGRADFVLPRGEYRFLAFAEGCGRGFATSAVPRTSAEALPIEMPQPRDVAVEVVAKENGAPLAGATLALDERIRGNGWMWDGAYLPPRDVPPTDAAGRTTIRGLGTVETLTVRAAAPGRPAPGPRWMGFLSGASPTIKPGDLSLRIEVELGRTVRWPVTDEEGPIPPEGSVLRLRDEDGAARTPRPETARVEGRFVVADGWRSGFLRAIAEAPDGALAPLFVRAEDAEGMKTSFRPARTVVVRAKRPDGTPATGLFASVRDQGNNLLGRAVALDERGVARVGGLYAGLVQAYLADSAESYSGWAVGTFDLRKGDGEAEAVVEPKVPVVLRLRIDGKPALPDEFHVSCGNRPVVPEEDPERGELRFAVRPVASGSMGPRVRTSGGMLVLSATGFLTVQREVPLTPDAAPVEIDLERGGALAVEVRMPADGRVSTLVQRWDDAKGAWVGAVAPGVMGGRVSSDGKARYDSLASGRYRLVDQASGLASGEVRVTAGGPDATLAFDASGVGDARGRVEGPEGADLSVARVRIRGAPPDPYGWGPGSGTSVAKDGRFGLRVPGDREVVLEVTHPLLVAAPDGGSVAVTKPTDGLVLRLVAGTTARMRWSPPPKPAPWEREAAVRVLLFAGEPTGAALHEAKGVVQDDVVRFGGFPAGRYTVWIDGPPYAPLVLRDVALGEGETDLGEARPEKGATLRLRILPKEGEAPPRIGVNLRRVGEPSYWRYVISRGEDAVDVPGLERGSFELSLSPQAAAPLPRTLKETVESDGVSTIERTLDLR